MFRVSDGGNVGHVVERRDASIVVCRTGFQVFEAYGLRVPFRGHLNTVPVMLGMSTCFQILTDVC